MAETHSLLRTLRYNTVVHAGLIPRTEVRPKIRSAIVKDLFSFPFKKRNHLTDLVIKQWRQHPCVAGHLVLREDGSHVFSFEHLLAGWPEVGKV